MNDHLPTARTVGSVWVEKTSPNNQVLSQTITTGVNGRKKLHLLLDFWTPTGGSDGSMTDLAHLALRFHAPRGTTLTLRDGSPVPPIQDLTKPFTLKAITGAASTLYDVSATVYSTPIRVSQKDEPGITDGTGAAGLKYFADPEIVADEGKYYIFPTTDGYSGWRGWQIRCFESDDLVTWTDRGVVVDLKDQNLDGQPDAGFLPSRTCCAWAPAVIRKDGRYYLYFCGNAGRPGTNQTNVAVSRFIDHGYAIQAHAGPNHDGIVANNIDPAVFRDPADPSSFYLAWGQSPGMYARLSPDMLSLVPGTTVQLSATRNMREGSYLIARKDPADWQGCRWIYYYTYCIDDTNSPDYRVAYAYAKGQRLADLTADDWHYGRQILFKNKVKGLLGTGHHAILHIPGTDDWYIAYHCFLPDSMRPRGVDRSTGEQIHTGNKREIRLARLTFDKKGQIQPVNVTYEWASPPAQE